MQFKSLLLMLHFFWGEKFFDFQILWVYVFELE